jgi:RecB family exonuclease
MPDASRTLSIVTSGDDLRAWLIQGLSSLPADLSRRATIVLPSLRIAHQLRRHLCLDGHSELLTGVAFLRAEDLAREMLVHAAEPRNMNRSDLRTIGLKALFAGSEVDDLPLAYFEAQQLTASPGYAEAIAATIEELDDAGLTPVDLEAVAEEWRGASADIDTQLAARRVQDTATLWKSIDENLRSGDPQLRSAPEALREASDRLTRNPQLVAPSGQVFAVLPPQPTPTLLHFLSTLPGASVALLTGRPIRRLGERVIDATATALGTARPASPQPPVTSTTELDLMHSYLFAPPEVLADESRPRSTGADGTVALEQYPGVQDEVSAAVSWALEQVTEHRTPLEEIAIIVPARELATFVVAALERPDKGTAADQIESTQAASSPEDSTPNSSEQDRAGALSTLPTYVAGGIHVTNSASGHLLLQLLRTLHAALDADSTIPLLPRLRLSGSERERITEAEAGRITYESGIIGGTPSHPDRASEWPTCLARRADALERQLAALDSTSTDDANAAEDDPEKAKFALRRRDAERFLANVRAILPAVDALTALASKVVIDAPLSTLWPAILEFYGEWCRVIPSPTDAARLLDRELRALCAHPIAERLRGRDAIAYMTERLGALRASHGRYGQPRIFIGTPADAMGLTFRAVRLLGTVEGVVPGNPREDPILPDDERRRLTAWLGKHRPAAASGLPTSQSRVLDQTHAIFFAATAARERLALSAPRQWIDGTDRELAGLMLETAVALGRPDAQSGTTERIPSLTRLRHDYIGTALEARAAYDIGCPGVTGAVLRSIATRPAGTDAPHEKAVPPYWIDTAAGDLFSLARIGAIQDEQRADSLTLSDGMLGAHLGPLADALSLPGIQPDRAISASALVTLLACPYRFFLERVLHLDAPSERPPMREIGQPYYGTLVHRVMEQFLREHGERFCRKDGTFEGWTDRILAVADRCFDEFGAEYPLLGDGTTATQRDRVRRDVRTLLQADWDSHLPLTFVGVEVPFGIPTPVGVALGDGRMLYLRGFIDRIDRKGGQLFIRDVKTGRAKPRDDDPMHPSLDTQLVVYSLVAPALAGTAGGRVELAAYTYPSLVSDRERAYDGAADLDALLTEGRAWLRRGADLLSARTFLHTADEGSCKYCPFVPVCGDDIHERSARKLKTAAPDSPEHGFAELQGATGDNGD